MIAVASKNDAHVVDTALDRDDLVLTKEMIYPIEANWGTKTASVQRILDTWNVSPDSVVFVDDSPMELAAVKEAYPEIECLQFPGDDYVSLWGFLNTLRNLFGRTTVTDEDNIRLSSVRASQHVREAIASAEDSTEFLQALQGSLTFSYELSHDPRVLELINKTNQFNLNGRRMTQTALHTALEEPSAFCVVVSYRDRFGPLGKIAVIVGRLESASLMVDAWVMSCRAFSRRIEHHCISHLLAKFNAEAIVFDYQPTTRNTVLQDFLITMSGGHKPHPWLRLSKRAVLASLPELVHEQTEPSRA
jgi:FkbH-like protein